MGPPPPSLSCHGHTGHGSHAPTGVIERCSHVRSSHLRRCRCMLSSCTHDGVRDPASSREATSRQLLQQLSVPRLADFTTRARCQLPLRLRPAPHAMPCRCAQQRRRQVDVPHRRRPSHLLELSNNDAARWTSHTGGDRRTSSPYQSKEFDGSRSTSAPRHGCAPGIVFSRSSSPTRKSRPAARGGRGWTPCRCCTRRAASPPGASPQTSGTR